jgi:hypothetical protein
MLTSHELFGFMSPALAAGILEKAYETDRDTYRATLGAVAEAKKLRPQFFERMPRATRHADMIAMLAKPRLELAAANLIRNWLMRDKKSMLIDFLDALGIEHKEGAVDDLPKSMPDEKLKPAIDKLLAKYPPEEVAIYLNAFDSMNEIQWTNLDSMLKEDARLQFGG